MILNYSNDFTKVDIQSSVTVTGNITASGDIITNSDVRLKSNIRPIESALTLVCALNGRLYTKDGRDNQVGLIAQEVEQVLPQLVHEGLDDMKTKSVNYQNTVALLIEAIKEQQQQITDLKEQVRGLQNR